MGDWGARGGGLSVARHLGLVRGSALIPGRRPSSFRHVRTGRVVARRDRIGPQGPPTPRLMGHRPTWGVAVHDASLRRALALECALAQVAMVETPRGDAVLEWVSQPGDLAGIVLGFDLPDLRGDEVLRRMRAHGVNQPPMILIGGGVLDPVATRYGALLNVPVLRPPLTLADLRAALRG